MCRLTWAQAAICHPTLASLILILSPAWPSRPTVSSPQKAFLQGGVELGRQRRGGAGGAPQRGPLTWSLARRPRQTASCLLPASSLFYQPHRPQGLTERQRRGRRKRRREGEGGGQINTMKRLTRTTPTSPPSFIFGFVSLYSLWAGCCPLPCVTPLSSLPSFIPLRPFKLPDSVWPSMPLLAIYTLPFSSLCVK